MAGVRDLFFNPGAVLSSVTDAVSHVADEGLGGGPAKALDAILPPGTLARSDLEGVMALIRQVPEVMGDLYRSGAIAIPEEAPNADEGFTRVREKLTEALSPEGIASIADSAVDGLRKTPKMLQEPGYEVMSKHKGYEVRRYRRFTLATRTAGFSPADGLSVANPLSAMTVHLTNSRNMNMTMYAPVLIRYHIRELEPMSVSFMVPPGTKVAEDDMELVQVPERVLAVRQFPGIATSDEVRRQYEMLCASLEETQIFEPYKQGFFAVLQYNPPFTIPWRRRNEIAIEVVHNAANAAINRRIAGRQHV